MYILLISIHRNHHFLRWAFLFYINPNMRKFRLTRWSSSNYFVYLRILTGKKHPKIKLQR